MPVTYRGLGGGDLSSLRSAAWPFLCLVICFNCAEGWLYLKMREDYARRNEVI